MAGHLDLSSPEETALAAIWSVLEADKEFSGVIRTRLKWDGSLCDMEAPPLPAQMPAMRIDPVESPAGWESNGALREDLHLRITGWTRDTHLADLFGLLHLIRTVLFKTSNQSSLEAAGIEVHELIRGPVRQRSNDREHRYLEGQMVVRVQLQIAQAE